MLAAARRVGGVAGHDHAFGALELQAFLARVAQVSVVAGVARAARCVLRDLTCAVRAAVQQVAARIDLGVGSGVDAAVQIALTAHATVAARAALARAATRARCSGVAARAARATRAGIAAASSVAASIAGACIVVRTGAERSASSEHRRPKEKYRDKISAARLHFGPPPGLRAILARAPPQSSWARQACWSLELVIPERSI